jgi:hypothetical protein
MSIPAKKVKIMIPYFWKLFRRYLNNPSYFIRASDEFHQLFGRGEEDVKDFISLCNNYAEEMGLEVRFTYKEHLTYSNLLNQLNYEQITFH